MKQHEAGVSLIEVMVAVLIMAVGILGMVGLQVTSLQLNRGALMRAEAMQLGNDILDRVRANPTGDYDGIGFDDAPPSSNNCVANTCSTSQMTDFDVAQWKCSINSVDEDGDTYPICSTLGITGALPLGAGSIDVTADVTTVQVRWQSGSEGQTSTVTLRGRLTNDPI
ncbi:MAG: type IV pilus modification protein PilV [Pseudomonadota bacterium]